MRLIPRNLSFNFIFGYLTIGVICLGIGFFGYYASRITSNYKIISNNLQFHPDWELGKHEFSDISGILHEICKSDDSISKLIRHEIEESCKELKYKTVDFKEVSTIYLISALNNISASGKLVKKKIIDSLHGEYKNIYKYLIASKLYGYNLNTKENILISRHILGERYAKYFNNHYFTRWDYWNFAAIILTLLYSLLFLIDCFFKFGRKGLADGLNSSRAGIIVITYIFALISIVASLFGVLKHEIFIKLWSLLLFFICWMLIDIIIMRYHESEYIREEFRKLLWHIEIPFIIAISILMLFVATNVLSVEPRETEIFVSGAIAFKVILQNISFLTIVTRIDTKMKG